MGYCDTKIAKNVSKVVKVFAALEGLSSAVRCGQIETGREVLSPRKLRDKGLNRSSMVGTEAGVIVSK